MKHNKEIRGASRVPANPSIQIRHSMKSRSARPSVVSWMKIILIGCFPMAYAHAEPRDEVCFPLYRDAGAIPLTSSCRLIASLANVGMGTYDCTANSGIDRIVRYCGVTSKDAGPTCNGIGNPVNSATGNKYQTARDYSGVGSFPLIFERYYNSSVSAAQGRSLGSVWRSNYDRTIAVVDSSNTAAYRHDGKIIYFTLTSNAWKASADISDKLVQLKDAGGNTTGWTLYYSRDQLIETYNADGRLISIKAPNGQAQTLTLSTTATPATVAPDSNYLIAVTDQSGRRISWTWNSLGYISTMTDPEGNIYNYGYDSTEALSSVSYPKTLSTDSTQPTRLYAYNEQAYTGNNALPNAFTGITDENGVRFATYLYDNQGRAINEWHAGTVEQYQLSFGTNGTSVTDPRGTQRTYNFTTVLGVMKSTGQSQPGGSGCNASSSSITYDPNGNLKSRTDFDGHTTTYTYDLTRNLELTRVEGSGTAAARTISTQWHPDWRLETKRAEPKKMNTWVYNGQPDPTASNAIASCAPATAKLPDGKPIAVLCKKIEQATTDATGAAGFSSTRTGTQRIATWTYNSYGQVLTANGPRTDVTDTTTTTYYTDTTADHTLGDLWKITNPAGHVTEYTRYDKNGRLLQMKDPNGLVTTLSYTRRGWLKTRQVGTELTSYDYDKVGQLKKVTLPDTSWIGYDYDSAHRLVAIYDSLNNRITYTLDNAGNRTKEDVTDPKGVLARTQSRVYDALGRLQNLVQPQ